MSGLLGRAAESVQTFMDTIMNTETGRAMVASAETEQREKRHAARQEWAAEIAKIDADELAAVRQHDKAMAPIVAKIGRLRRELETAAAEAERVRGPRAEQAFRASRRREALLNQLRATASTDLIGAFVARVDELMAETFRRRDTVNVKAIDGQWYPRWSNEASVQARVDALLQLKAIARDGLPFEALDDAGLQARCAALLASLPDVDTRPAQYREDA